MKTYEHHVFRRANGDRGCSATVGFDCSSCGRLNLKLAIDFLRFAASARKASSESCIGSGGDEEAAWEQLFMCACAIATWSSLLDKLRRPRASQVAHRPSSIKAVLVRPTRPRRGHWARFVSSGRGGLTDVIRRTS